MPVFISYSHNDKEIVDLMAAYLVKNNASVWVDTWELNVGDSILNKVQDAIQKSSALLVILSKSSVESEWCKKELSAGLMRELGEKKVIVLPVLIEDCEIPIFLKEKMYADLRGDFEVGIKSIVDAIAKVTNADQGRLYEEDGYSDWAVDWGFKEELFYLRYTIVHSSNALPMTFLTEIYVFCNEIVTKRYNQFVDAGLDWIGRAVSAEALFDFGEKATFRLILENTFQKELKATISDPKRGAEYEVVVLSRKLGEDNGKDQIINVSYYLKEIRNYVRSISRKLTPEESWKLKEIIDIADVI